MAVGDLVVNLLAKTDRFSRGLQTARRDLSAFSASVVSIGSKIASFGAIAGGAIGGLGVFAVKLAADAEQTAISFEVMTGSAERASKLVADLRAMGAKTPFEFTDLADGAKTLMAFGRSADQVLGDLGMLSDVAAGDANKLHSLALVFGQVAANARLTGGDLLQFINTGFNPLQEIAKKTGETMAELRDRMSKGAIGFEEVRQAFIDATSAGGRFFGMNDKQSQTLLGRWSTLKDEITTALIEIGGAIMENLDLKAFLSQLSEMTKTAKEDFIPALEGMLKIAPKLFEAFGKLASAIGALGERTNDWLEAWERMNVILQAKASGQSVEDVMAELNAMKGKGQPGVFSLEPKQGDIFDFMPNLKARRDKNAAEQAAEQATEQQQGVQAAERMMAGFIREGLDKMTSGVMGLGKERETEEARNEVRSLEQGSAEAFEVMRANAGPAKAEDTILKNQLKTQEKMFAEMKKFFGKSVKQQYKELKIAGID